MKATIRFRRLATVLGVATMLALAGCGSTVPGVAKPAGDTPTPERKPADESADEPEESGFDECGLVEPDKIAEWIGVDALYITGRSAMTLNTVTDTDPERFFAPFKKYDNVLPIEDPGDRGLHLYYTYSDGGVMPDLQGGADVGTLLREALEQLPDEVTIPDGTPEGPCADIDLEAAAEALGAELAMARSVVTDGDAVSCFFSGDGANLDSGVLTDPTRTKQVAVAPGDVTHDDIGDGARLLITEADSLDARVNVGDNVVAITATYGSAAGTLTSPRQEDVELVRTIVDALGEED